MEKLDKHQSKEYGPLVMWAGDLAQLLSELMDCSKIEFVADDVKYESAEEFVKESKGKFPSEVTITANNPYLTVNLRPMSARLYVSSSELLPTGLFIKVDSILSRCERKPKLLYNYAFMLGSTWLLSNTWFLPQLKPHTNLYALFIGLAFSWVAYVLFVRLKRFSIVRPNNREDTPGFVRRNIDTIVIAIISALIGAVGGAAATKFADRVWPNSPNIAVERDAPHATKPLTPHSSP